MHQTSQSDNLKQLTVTFSFKQNEHETKESTTMFGQNLLRKKEKSQ